MDEMWLAFEGGGTKTRMLLARPDGEILAREVGSCSNNYYIDPVQYPLEMAERLGRLGRVAQEAGGAVCVAGLAGPMDVALVRKLIGDTLGAQTFVHADEAEIALACCGLRRGIALVAGTGSSCMAYDDRGRTLKAGGFGPQFDDLGSAYWIGREAVAAVVRAEDGRGPATALHDRLLAYTGIGRSWELLKRCDRNGHVPRQFIAAFAPEVFSAAREGDAVARRLCREAGKALAELIAATARQSDFGGRPAPVVVSGGVFHGAALLLPALRRTLKARDLSFELYPPVLEPAHGIFRVIAQRNGRDSGVS